MLGMRRFVDNRSGGGIIGGLLRDKSHPRGVSMLIEVDKIPREGIQVSQDFEFLSADLVEEEAVFLEPAHVELAVNRLGEQVLVKGQMNARLSVMCSRCLQPYELPLSLSFDLIYFPEELDEIKEELDEEDINRLFYYNRQIDLRDVILEQINLAFPLKPLCSEDCEGICPVCGSVRRHGGCKCAEEKSDPRLEKLKLLKR